MIHGIHVIHFRYVIETYKNCPSDVLRHHPPVHEGCLVVGVPVHGPARPRPRLLQLLHADLVVAQEAVLASVRTLAANIFIVCQYIISVASPDTGDGRTGLISWLSQQQLSDLIC